MSVRSAELARPRPAARGSMHRPVGSADCSCGAEASRLLAAVTRDGLGAVSPSVYETARVVAAGAWLPGHRSRIEYLLTTQRPDGGWGGPEAYALVPTLSATEALLGIVLEPPPRLSAPLHARCVRAVADGLAFARAQLRSLRAADLPDTVAIEVIVPYLVARLQDGLARLRTSDVSGLDAWRGRVRLPLPRGMTDEVLRALLAALDADAPPPLKAMHSLEIFGALATRVPGVPRLALGTVGAAPAATVAWLGPAPGDRSGPAVRYLRRVIAQHGGPVACVIPITNFERAWVVNSLASAGLAQPAPRLLGPRMAAVLGRRAIGGGDGMPPDADTTSATLTALRYLGVAVRDGLLRPYDAGTHFYTWAGERTASPTTNAHVLTALATSDARRTAWRTSAVQRVARWLCDIQHSDGLWSDKWHASPFYATACAIAALRDVVHMDLIVEAGLADRLAAAVDRAVTWVLDSQQRNGSWGRWTGTAEETAYALQILLYRAVPDRRTGTAVRRGLRFLLATGDRDPEPLWHGKELYAPANVVRAAVIGSRHLAEAALGLASTPATGPSQRGARRSARAILAA
jgi:halimadienyl-diphosphate synthase